MRSCPRSSDYQIGKVIPVSERGTELDDSYFVNYIGEIELAPLMFIDSGLVEVQSVDSAPFLVESATDPSWRDAQTLDAISRDFRFSRE